MRAYNVPYRVFSDVVAEIDFSISAVIRTDRSIQSCWHIFESSQWTTVNMHQLLQHEYSLLRIRTAAVGALSNASSLCL